MSLGRRLLRSTGLNLLDHFVRLASVLIISPLMIRSLGSETYAVWVLLMSVFGYFTLLDAGLTVSGSHFAARALGQNDNDAWRRVMGTCHRMYGRAGNISLILTLLFALLLPLFFGGRPDLPYIVCTVILYGVAIAVRFYCKTYAIAMRAHLRYDLIVLPGMLRSVVQMGLLWLVIQQKGGLGMLGLVYAASELAEVIIVSRMGTKVLHLRWRDLADSARERSDTGKDLVRHARSSFMTLLGYNLRSKLDPVIVGALTTLPSVTLYSVGTRFIGFFEDLINALLGGQFLAAFSRMEGEKVEKAFLDSTRLGVMAAVLCGAGLMLIGPPFIERWMGPDFAEAGVLLLILTPPYVLRLMQYSVANLLYLRGCPQILAWITLVGGVFNLALSILLVRLIGFHGVVWGTAAELTLVSLFVLPAFVRSKGGIPIATYLGLMGRSLALACLPALLCWWLLRPLLIPDYRSLAVAGVVLTVASVGWYWVAMLSAAERAILRGLIGRKSN